MKKIVSSLFLIILILIEILFMLGFSFDKFFVINLVNNLLANTLIFFIAIFVIDDYLIKINKDKLVKINDRQSKFVYFQINIIFYKILVHLGKVKSDYAAELKKDPNIDFTWAKEEFIKIGNENDWDEIFCEHIIANLDKEDYLLKLVEIFKKGSESLHDSLKKIYPNPNPIMVEMVDELTMAAGTLNAISQIMGTRGEVNSIIDKNTETGKKNLSGEEFLKILIKISIFGQKEKKFSPVFNSLLKLSSEAEKGLLFID